jgi:hypothetical protein
MREQLVSYVNLLFAGTTDTEDIRQEILQNTLDRYDDLVAQGKAPEAAYRLAISGIGDINEILSGEGQAASDPLPEQIPTPEETAEEKENKNRRAAAIAFYIASPIPLFALGSEIGLCLMLLLIAAATALIVMSSKKDPEPIPTTQTNPTAYTSATKRSPETRKLIKTIGIVNLVICVAIYLVISFLTSAWLITWLTFPLFACIHGLIVACIDLKEAT